MVNKFEEQDLKVLFLTNNENTTELYDWLRKRCETQMYSKRLDIELVIELQTTLIVSYNYKYIIGSDIIQYMDGNILNLHISYLPWNRGASPNFWSFVDHTPKGVTIHQISVGLDEGNILYQKELLFDEEKETFTTSYTKLNNAIVELFKENWDEIKMGNYELYEQKGTGSYHTQKELEVLKQKIEFDWNDNIADFLKRYEESVSCE